MRFKDRVVLITGASRGIGKSCAELFAKEGAKIILNFRSNNEAAFHTLNSLKANDHMVYQCDIADPDAIESMVKIVIDKYGHIDVLVNNAGIFEAHPIDQVDYNEWKELWQRTMQTNLTGLANLSFLVAKEMIKKKKGSIINISSRGAFRGEPDCPAYGASKGGLNSLSQSLAKSLGKYNIAVTAIAPGFVATDMAEKLLTSPEGESIRNESPFNRVAKPEEVARIALFLAERESQFLSGGIIDINGASFLRM